MDTSTERKAACVRVICLLMDQGIEQGFVKGHLGLYSVLYQFRLSTCMSCPYREGSVNPKNSMDFHFTRTILKSPNFLPPASAVEVIELETNWRRVCMCVCVCVCSASVSQVQPVQISSDFLGNPILRFGQNGAGQLTLCIKFNFFDTSLHSLNSGKDFLSDGGYP